MDFVLVGGYAVGVHGVIRATGDIDFFYRRTEGNVKRLCAALADFGAPEEVINVDDLMRKEIVTQFGKPPLRIDLLNAIDGVTSPTAEAGEHWACQSEPDFPSGFVLFERF